MQERRTVGILTGLRFDSRVLRRIGRAFARLALAVTAMNGTAAAQSIEVTVDSSLADYLLDVVCSNADVDEAYLRSSPVVQAQVKHHTNLSSLRNFDALLKSLEAASKCQIPVHDVYRVGPIVENKAQFQATVEFLKSRAPDIKAFVAESLTPFTPKDLTYSGSIVLSIIGNPCGGFASGAYFFLALNCLTTGYEGEYSAVKVVSAHEVFHALQHEFFFPGNSEFDKIGSREDALVYLFRWLVGEGTAEYVADSRQVKGSGRLTELLTGFAENGYRQIPLYTDFFGYAAEIVSTGDDFKERLRKVYELGFSGANRQVFYYTGASMAGHLDRTYGRDALICIFRLPPEQFVRAYQGAALKSPSKVAVPLSETVVEAANRIGRQRGNHLRFETCVK